MVISDQEALGVWLPGTVNRKMFAVAYLELDIWAPMERRISICSIYIQYILGATVLEIK